MWELGEERLVKLIVEKLREAGGVGWRAQYEVLLRRYGLEEEEDGQAGSAAEWKRRVRKLNGSKWKEEVEAMSSERYLWCGEVCCIIDNRVLWLYYPWLHHGKGMKQLG